MNHVASMFHVRPHPPGSPMFPWCVFWLLSEHSVASNWVAHEVETTLNRQARERRDLLFP